MRFSKAPHEDVTQKMADFTAQYLPKIGDLAGFIVCAKSPSCGMERVRLYDENGNRGRKEASGCSPPPSLKLTRGCRSKKMAACTIPFCGKTLSSACLPFTN